MKKRIPCAMLIDDHYPSNLLHEMVIEEVDYIEQTLIFNDATSALTYLQNGPTENGPWPSIIFLDINMPKVNGWEFLRLLNNNCDHLDEDMIIVILTTSNNAYDKLKAKRSTAIKEYLQKPLNVNKLDQLANKYFV